LPTHPEDPNRTGSKRLQLRKEEKETGAGKTTRADKGRGERGKGRGSQKFGTCARAQCGRGSQTNRVALGGGGSYPLVLSRPQLPRRANPPPLRSSGRTVLFLSFFGLPTLATHSSMSLLLLRKVLSFFFLSREFSLEDARKTSPNNQSNHRRCHNHHHAPLPRDRRQSTPVCALARPVRTLPKLPQRPAEGCSGRPRQCPNSSPPLRKCFDCFLRRARRIRFGQVDDTHAQ